MTSGELSGSAGDLQAELFGLAGLDPETMPASAESLTHLHNQMLVDAQDFAVVAEKACLPYDLAIQEPGELVTRRRWFGVVTTKSEPHLYPVWIIRGYKDYTGQPMEVPDGDVTPDGNERVWRSRCLAVSAGGALLHLTATTKGRSSPIAFYSFDNDDGRQIERPIYYDIQWHDESDGVASIKDIVSPKLVKQGDVDSIRAQWRQDLLDAMIAGTGSRTDDSIARYSLEPRPLKNGRR